MDTHGTEGELPAAATALALLGADLHDGPLQSLTALALDARALRDQLPALLADEHAPELVEGRLDDLLARMAALDTEVRELVASTRPPSQGTSDGAVLEEAIQHEARTFAEATGIAPTLDLDLGLAGDVAPAVPLLARIARAALANVGAHADAREVAISLRPAGPDAVLAIADDGRGFDPRGAARSGRPRLGIDGIALRAAMLGGVLELESRPGGPTRLAVRFPRRPAGRAT